MYFENRIIEFVYSSDSARKSDWVRGRTLSDSLIRFIGKVLTCVVELENKTFDIEVQHTMCFCVISSYQFI